MKGQIRVGRRIYNNKLGTYVDPTFEGFTPIVVMTASTAYGSLGPYVLKDEQGRIMENLYQAMKVYPTVPATTQTYSRYDSTVIWSHPAETHAVRETNGWIVKPAYKKWRKKLMNCKYAVRYPVGFDVRHTCIFSLAETEDGKISTTPLNYIEARKQIYTPLYIKLVKQQSLFQKLQQRYLEGEQLMIVEVDGPHQESLSYYVEKYGVDETFIQNDTMLATPKNLSIMLNDSKHPFGHGFCLAAALQDLQID